MVILTTIYISAVVYAKVDVNSYDYANSHRYVVYAAYERESDTPPTEWYTPEELGIVEIWDIGKEGGAVQIVVDREKEPFPFGPYGTDEQLTIFLYKDEFYIVSHHWVTFATQDSVPWEIPIGTALGVGWVFTGVLFLKWKKKQ
jgi:hypothetical protein